MFSKLLGSLSKKENKQETKQLAKIAKMDLVEMRNFVNGKYNDIEVDEYALREIIKKVMSVNENSSKYYIEDNDMDSKKKKAFDLIILILKHKLVSVLVVESAQKFLEVYEEMIQKYDYDNKQIYEKKIKDSISIAVNTIDTKTDINEKMRVVQ